MWSVIEAFCLIVLVFPKPIESGWGLRWRSRNNKAIIPELAARIYESFKLEGAHYELMPGFWKVAVAHEMGLEYVIGHIESGPKGDILCPFVAPRSDLQNKFGRIKILLEGKYATMFEPIFKTDRLNDLFFKKYPAEGVREVEIKRNPLPLVPAHSGTVANEI